MDDIDEINKCVPREGGDVLSYIPNSIKYKITLGLFDELGQLKGWAFGVDMGTTGTLGVTEDSQQRGVAGVLGVKFSNMIVDQNDMDLLWNVNHGNDKSHGLARKFGAKNIGTVTWMAVNRRVTKKMTKMGMFQIFYPKI